MLSSSSLVKLSTVSVSSIFASFKTSSSSPSPFMTIVLFKLVAISSALSLFFSIIFTLTPFKCSSRFLARLNPILPPPIIRIFFETFSSCPKADKSKLICEDLITT